MESVTPILGGVEDVEDADDLRLLVHAVDHEVPVALAASADGDVAKIRRVGNRVAGKEFRGEHLDRAFDEAYIPLRVFHAVS